MELLWSLIFLDLNKIYINLFSPERRAKVYAECVYLKHINCLLTVSGEISGLEQT